MPGELAARTEPAITKGRAGDQKKYKDLASPMPAQSMSDARLSGLIAYLKNELQK